MKFTEIKGRTYQPVHGKGWRPAEWQCVRVFTRARGFGPDAWIEELQMQSKKPEETPDSMRQRLMHPKEEAEDMRLEAVDR